MMYTSVVTDLVHKGSDTDDQESMKIQAKDKLQETKTPKVTATSVQKALTPSEDIEIWTWRLWKKICSAHSIRFNIKII